MYLFADKIKKSFLACFAHGCGTRVSTTVKCHLDIPLEKDMRFCRIFFGEADHVDVGSVFRSCHPLFGICDFEQEKHVTNSLLIDAFASCYWKHGNTVSPSLFEHGLSSGWL
jgi:hypothetical protein